MAAPSNTFHLEVATPERLVLDAQVTEAELPAKEGYMGILPGHAALLTMLGAGTLTYSDGGVKKAIDIDGGFVEIYDNHVRVLADKAGTA